MCGIFSILNYEGSIISPEEMVNEFSKGVNRGPEFSILDGDYPQMNMGFHRLAINGLNSESNQPISIDDVVLICNGEIYNYKQIYKMLGIEAFTGSDCEVIIHLYIRYGIEHTLNLLDGVFSFILLDNRAYVKKLYVARDPFGVRPLYQVTLMEYGAITKSIYGFASELKCLQHFYNKDFVFKEIIQFKPATYSEFLLPNNDFWVQKRYNIPYFIPAFSQSLILNEHTQKSFIMNIFNNISSLLNAAVTKRCIATERPIACLLSGGLDSSLIAALVNNYYRSRNPNHRIETYSIGLKGSEDLKYAKIVATYLNTKHTEIIVTEKEMANAIPEVIQDIESYDTTTVRASIGNYLIGKYISKNSEAKVIFNGDGSDELFGGYLYMNKCPDDLEFDKETRRLLNDIYLFDVLRSDKSISSHGLEPRTPFLDKTFVNYVLTIPPYFRNHKNIDKCEKFILRKSFDRENFLNYEGGELLPEIILWRKKEAFSDGVSSHGRSLYLILQEHIANELHTKSYSKNEDREPYKPCIETEKYYYRSIFENAFPNCAHILPYFWMPKYTNATDPSARTLDIYTST